jgi:hypothetical protein
MPSSRISRWCVPCCAMTPPSSTITRSASAIVDRRCANLAMNSCALAARAACRQAAGSGLRAAGIVSEARATGAADPCRRFETVDGAADILVRRAGLQYTAQHRCVAVDGAVEVAVDIVTRGRLRELPTVALDGRAKKVALCLAIGICARATGRLLRLADSVAHLVKGRWCRSALGSVAARRPPRAGAAAASRSRISAGRC